MRSKVTLLRCRSARWAGAIAILMLVATGGWYARLGVERAATPGEGSAEVGFARDMSRHHQQAVYMAILAVEHGSTSDVRQLGNDIVLVQQAEIGTMTAWLNNWGVPATSGGPPMAWMKHTPATTPSNGEMPGMASKDELRRLQAARGRPFDILFCQLMLRHHLGGTHMTDAILSRTRRTEVHGLASALRNTQRFEIAELTRHLDVWGARPL
jgi:uncharacterized protein (DUF305 family)